MVLSSWPQRNPTLPTAGQHWSAFCQLPEGGNLMLGETDTKVYVRELPTTPVPREPRGSQWPKCPTPKDQGRAVRQWREVIPAEPQSTGAPPSITESHSSWDTALALQTPFSCPERATPELSITSHRVGMCCQNCTKTCTAFHCHIWETKPFLLPQ